MKKHLLTLLAFACLTVTSAQAQLTGWGYLNAFPWMYLTDEESWGYVYQYNGYYWVYVMETEETKFVADAYPDGDAPGSLEGKTIVFQLLSEGERGTATAVFGVNRQVVVTVVYGDESITFTGSYDYQRDGDDIGDLDILVVDEDDVLDSFFNLRFGEDGEGYYLSIEAENEELPEAGEDGQYGVFNISDTVL